jgi:hypothetical protein
MKWYPFSVHSEYKPGGLQPHLPIKIIHPEDSNTYVVVHALIDTGASISKIPAKYADRISIDYNNGEVASGVTADGEGKGHWCKCRIQVLDMDETGNELPDIILSELGMKGSCVFGECAPIPLLGVADFLKNYVVTVDYPNKRFSLGNSN